MRFLMKLLDHWRLYLLFVILTTAAGTLFGAHKLSVYESTAYIYVQNAAEVGGISSGISGSAYNTPAQNAAAAIGELLPSDTFILSVVQATDLAKTNDLSTRAGKDTAITRTRGEISVAPSLAGPDTFTITVDDKDAHISQQIAQSVVVQFTKEYTARQVAYDTQAATVLGQQLQDANSAVTQDKARANQYIQSHPELASQPASTITDPTYAEYQQTLQQDLASAQHIADQLKLVQFRIVAESSGTVNVLKVYDQPSLPKTPTLHTKQLITYILAGLGGGLAVIVLICGVQTLRDKSVYSKNDVRSILEDLDLNITSIEQVPVLHGIGEQHGHTDDHDSTYSGILVPVLTVLPQLGAGAMTQEIRRVVGAGAKSARPDDGRRA